jgi:hypothetical protein
MGHEAFIRWDIYQMEDLYDGASIRWDKRY